MSADAQRVEWSQRYKVFVRVLGIKTRFSRRSGNAFNQRAISPASSFLL
ncbi:mCG148035 [Mus musculus]|nr:mCG148035 [Mus musculus]